MTYYEISKHFYDSEEVHNYGGGYTAEDVKQIMKGLKKETLDFIGGFICCVCWIVLAYFVILFFG